RREESHERIPPQQAVGKIYPSANRRENSQYDQRNSHYGRRFVQVMLFFSIDAGFAKERHEDQPEHVERREPRGDHAEKPEPRMSRIVRGFEDKVLGEVTGERRHGGDRERRG